MTITDTRRTLIEATMPAPFADGWNRLEGVTVDGPRLTIDTAAYFWRYSNPTWLLCPWEDVRRDLLNLVEAPDVALEQLVLDYVKANGHSTSDPAEVLATAWCVYDFLFDDRHLSDPDLADVDPAHLRILREMGCVMSLNRVELTGEISNAGPAWLFGDTAQVVFGLTTADTENLDELYHGTWFNETRRVESIKAHAALGGRLVHGCQSVPNQSGGVVAPYGVDVARFSRELAGLKNGWRQQIIDQATH